MLQVFFMTLLGILRDRVFQGIIIASVLFAFIPSVSSLSMRQVAELSISLSLSLISFILLLLSVFLGGTSLWKDMERRYTFSILGFPLTRTSYVLGKFFGLAVFVLLTTAVLGLAASAVIWFTNGAYPPLRPVIWTNLYMAIFFSALKYILIVAMAFFFSTVSTSFFLPIFGTISMFLVGSATQEVYDFIQTAATGAFSPFIKKVVSVLYYLLPNFSAFDLELNAVYSISLSPSGILLTLLYFIIYTAILLTLSVIVFSRREML